MNNRIYLAVSYDDKEDAKSMGARWDPIKKLWYAASDNYELIEKYHINDEPVRLIGEDRNFGGNDLFIDMIPRSCWFTNVRKMIHRSDWDRVRKHIYDRVDGKCECCGSSNIIEAHERWSYDGDTKIQKLMRLIALCKRCHESTHMGLSAILCKEDSAKAHLMTVRGFDETQLQMHIDDAYKLFAERSKVNWILDIDIITCNGIRLNDNIPSPDDRKDIAIICINNINQLPSTVIY